MMFVHIIPTFFVDSMTVPLSCLYTFWHTIPTSLGIFNDFYACNISDWSTWLLVFSALTLAGLCCMGIQKCFFLPSPFCCRSC